MKGTQLQFISGIAKPTDGRRVDDSPHGKAPVRYLNWADKTEGEFYLQLLLHNVLIDKAYYGDPTGIYQRAENMIYGALSSGLHTTSGNTSFGAVPMELNSIAAAVRSAKYKTKSASRFDLDTAVAGPFDPYGNDPFTLDCSALITKKLSLEAQVANAANSNLPASVVNNLLAQIAEIDHFLSVCQAHGHQIALLNDRFEKSSYDYTYNYLTPQERNTMVAPVVASKANTHQVYLERMGVVSGLSYANLALWGDNGIKRMNVNKGTQPWTGNESAFGIGYTTLDGDTSGITVGIAPAVAIALIQAAVVITAAIIEARQRAKALHEAQNPSDQYQLTSLIGSAPGEVGFDPSGDDWAGYALPLVDDAGNPANPGNPSSGSVSTPVLIGGGLLAYYLLTQNS